MKKVAVTPASGQYRSIQQGVLMRQMSAALVCRAVTAGGAEAQQQMDSVTRAVDRVFDEGAR